VQVDAIIGRQPYQMVSLVRSLADAGRLPDVLIIHTGNNGPVSVNQLDSIVEAAAGRKVVFVTVRVGRPWEGSSNEAIRSMPARWGANVRVADWHEATEGRGDLFHSDGIHVGAEGGQLFANLVAWAVN